MFLPIPGLVISMVTFPGVIVHELAHQICCRLCRIPVYEVKYFQAKNPCGYVVHEATDNPWKNMITAMGPFLVNTILGILVTLPSATVVYGIGDLDNAASGPMLLLNLFLYWMGVSIMMHAFPSTGDAKAMVQGILKNSEVNILAKIVAAPFIGLIYIGAVGSFFWLDLIYAVAMSMLLPNLVALFF